MARLDVGIEAQELALASNTLNSVVWMVLTFAGGNELQYRATFHLLARPSPRYRGLLLRIHQNRTSSFPMRKSRRSPHVAAAAHLPETSPRSSPSPSPRRRPSPLAHQPSRHRAPSPRLLLLRQGERRLRGWRAAARALGVPSSPAAELPYGRPFFPMAGRPPPSVPPSSPSSTGWRDPPWPVEVPLLPHGRSTSTFFPMAGRGPPSSLWSRLPRSALRHGGGWGAGLEREGGRGRRAAGAVGVEGGGAPAGC